MTSIVRIDQVSQRFGGLQALKDVSFEITEREVLGIIGPNGAGKSTLFNAMVGVVPPVSGQVWFRDRDMVGRPTHEVVTAGLVKTSQTVQMFSEMSVLDNVAVAALGREPNLHAARDHAWAELTFWGLEGVSESQAQDLTLAQRSTCELARAMAMQPEVLLVDEVMAGLNEVEVDEMLIRMQRANDERATTLVIIEHNMRALMNISDRILALDYGEVIAHGEPEEVSRHPKVIAAYLGVE